MPFTLSKDQTIADQKLQQFLKDNTNKQFLLEGYAGTGKTTLLQYLLNHHLFHHLDICFAATTNKAVSVIQKMYNLNPKLELFGGLSLQIPMGSNSLYHQDYKNNLNGTFSIGTKYKLSNSASITFQCLYSTRGMKPYDSNNYLESITR